MSWDKNIDDECYMYLDKYYFSRRSFIPSSKHSSHGDIEDTILHSGDGLEDRLVAKDILYKFQAYLIAETGRGFNLRNRLNGYTAATVSWNIRKKFREFLKDNADE